MDVLSAATSLGAKTVKALIILGMISRQAGGSAVPALLQMKAGRLLWGTAVTGFLP